MRKTTQGQSNKEQQARNLFQIDQLIEQKVSIKDIEALLPGHFHINDAVDLSLSYFGDKVASLFKCSLEEAQKIGPQFQPSVMHPDDYNSLRPHIAKFIQENDHSQLLSFFQRLKSVDPNDDYQWHFTTCKLTPYGLVSTSHATNSIISAKKQIEQVLEEHTFFKKHMNRFLTLTKREKQVLKELAIGKTAIQIADEFFISENTVKTHRQKIYQKLAVKTFTELYQFAFHFNLLD